MNARLSQVCLITAVLALAACGETSDSVVTSESASATDGDGASYVRYVESDRDGDVEREAFGLTQGTTPISFPVEPEFPVEGVTTGPTITAQGIAGARPRSLGCGPAFPGLVCGKSTGFIGKAPILDQGQRGTCTVHALSTATRIYAAVHHPQAKDAILEPLDYSPDHMWQLAGKSCKDSGSKVQAVVKALASAEKGLSSELCWKYEKTVAGCDAKRTEIDKPAIDRANLDGLTRLDGWKPLDVGNGIAPIIETLNAGFPVHVALDATLSLQQLKTTLEEADKTAMGGLPAGAPTAFFHEGTLRKKAVVEKNGVDYPVLLGGHALVVIGYSVSGLLLVQNSWSAAWPSAAGGTGMFWLDPTLCGKEYEYVKPVIDEKTKKVVGTTDPAKKAYLCHFSYVSKYTFVKKDERAKIESKGHGECSLSKAPEASYPSIEMVVGEEKAVEPSAFRIGDGASLACPKVETSSEVSATVKSGGDAKGCIVTVKALKATAPGAPANVTVTMATTLASPVNRYKSPTLYGKASFKVTVKAPPPPPKPGLAKLALEYKVIIEPLNAADPAVHAMVNYKKGSVLEDVIPKVEEAPSVKSCTLTLVKNGPIPKGIALKKKEVALANGKKTYHCVLAGTLAAEEASRVVEMKVTLVTNEAKPRQVTAPLNLFVVKVVKREVSAVNVDGQVGVALESGAITSVALTEDEVTSQASVLTCPSSSPQLLPPGLSFSETGCGLTGTPELAGLTEIPVTWVLAGGEPIPGKIVLTVAPAELIDTTLPETVTVQLCANSYPSTPFLCPASVPATGTLVHYDNPISYDGVVSTPNPLSSAAPDPYFQQGNGTWTHWQNLQCGGQTIAVCCYGGSGPADPAAFLPETLECAAPTFD